MDVRRRKLALLTAILVVTAWMTPTPADAHCVGCVQVFGTDCFRCSLSAGTAENCIVGTPCSPANDTYNACANQGTCGPFAGARPVTFSEQLISDLSAHHARAAEILAWVNTQGGVDGQLVVFRADVSTPESGDIVEYSLTVQWDGDRPAAVELEAVVPFADDAGLPRLTFLLPGADMADSTPVAVSWLTLGV